MFEYRYKIKKINQPTTDLVLLDLETVDGQSIFGYSPGQYVMISFRNENGQIEEKHTFSIASSPTEQGVLRLGIRVAGHFTQGLVKLKIGAEILLYGPFGAFSFNEVKHLDAVFLAGGIGITPFLSALKYATDKKLSNKLSLLYSNRSLKSVAFYDELKQLEKTNPNLKTLFSVTDEEVNIPEVINERLSAENILKFIGNTNGKTFFICGPMPFMGGVKNSLLELGVKEEQILMEEFSMISSHSVFSKVGYFLAMAGYSVLAALLPLYLIYAANDNPGSVSAGVKGDKLDSQKNSDSKQQLQAPTPITGASTVVTSTIQQQSQASGGLLIPTPTTSSSMVAPAVTPANTRTPANNATIKSGNVPVPTTSASGVGSSSVAPASAPQDDYEEDDD